MGIKIDTVIIDPENNSREIILNYLAQIEDINVTQEFNDILTAMNFITESRPNLIIVDISQKTQMALDIIVKISNTLKNSKIIVLSYDMSPETVIKALRAGAREFLVKPLIENEFLQSVEKLKDLILGNINDTTKCKVITTFSNNYRGISNVIFPLALYP